MTEEVRGHAYSDGTYILGLSEEDLEDMFDTPYQARDNRPKEAREMAYLLTRSRYPVAERPRAGRWRRSH